MLIEISRYQQQHSTRNSFLRASRGGETPIRTKSIEAFGNTRIHPPSLPLYTHFIRARDAVAARPLVQLGGDCCFAPQTPFSLLSLLMIAACAPRQLTHTHSHMLIDTCQTAQPSIGCSTC